MVIKPDVAVGGHAWTWKAKITQFFIHEFQSMKQVSFQGDFYATGTNPSSAHIPLEHEVTGMRVVTEAAQRWSGDDIKVVALIMHKFIAMPICGQITTSCVAYELEDVGPREHLFAASKPGCIPPYPEKEDVMLVRATDWSRQKPTFAIAVVRNVTTQKYLLDVEGETSRRKDIATSADLEEQNYFVGEVELEWLRLVDRLKVVFKGLRVPAVGVQSHGIRW